MKVELDIDPGSLSLGILEILRGLSEEQKIKVASDIVKEWLSVEHKQEKELYEREIVTRLMKSERQNEGSVRSSYRFKEYMSNYKSCRDQMIGRIYEEGEKHIKKIIGKEIAASENYKKTFEEVINKLELNFPNYVQSALTSWFVNQMNEWSHTIMDTNINIPTMQISLQEIKDKLNSMGGII